LNSSKSNASVVCYPHHQQELSFVYSIFAANILQHIARVYFPFFPATEIQDAARRTCTSTCKNQIIIMGRKNENDHVIFVKEIAQTLSF
jgi:hypothetical protein